MKKTEIAVAIISILIIVFVFITIFVGWGAFGFGRGLNPNASPPSANATLFEKAEWEEHHGSICQCVPAFEIEGPLILSAPPNSTVSKITYNFTLIPGMTIPNLMNSRFKFSTKNAEKTVFYNDSSINLTWYVWHGMTWYIANESTNNIPDNFQEIRADRVVISAELDVEKMGFVTPGLGPNERFSIIMTPPWGYRYAVTKTTPSSFSPTMPIAVNLTDGY